jgi:hypothetical protein
MAAGGADLVVLPDRDGGGPGDRVAVSARTAAESRISADLSGEALSICL